MTVKYRSLSELCQTSIEKINPKQNPKKRFTYIDISSVDNLSKSVKHAPEVLGSEASVRARQVIHENDVLVSTTRPNLNSVAIIPPNLDKNICSTGFCVLRCGEDLLPRYLYYFVQSEQFVSALTDLVQGGLYPAVTNKQVLSQNIPWQPLYKQLQISSMLDSQFNKIEKSRGAINSQITDASQLLSKVLDYVFTPLKDSPKKKLKDYATCISGSTPRRDEKRYWSSLDIPWIKTGEVAFNSIDEAEEYISYAALDECSVKLLPPDTVLIAMYGQGKTRGQSAILKVEATTNQACFAILPNETWEPEYLYLWLRYSYQTLRALSEDRGGNQSNLNGGMLKALQVPTPSKTKQLEIVKNANEALIEIETIHIHCSKSLNDMSKLPQKIITQAFEIE